MANGALGELLKSTRKLLGMTQAVAAKRAGVSVRLWAEVERGERENVSLETALRMLGEMGIEVVLEGPSGDRIGLTVGVAAARARDVRAEVRRLTWTGRKLRLGDDDEGLEASRSVHPLAAVHEVSRAAYAFASTAQAMATRDKANPRTTRGKKP